MKKLYLIVGASGSGKDYMVDKICKERGMKKVISRTTRSPRYEGESTHKFVSVEQANKEWDKSLARTVYNSNMYYTIKEDLDDCDFYIIDPFGVKTMDRPKDRDIKVIYLKNSEQQRILNMIKRGDTPIQVEDRLKVDRKEFKDLEDLIDVVLTPSTFEEYFM